jgi:nicotinamidase-related amidase
LDFVELQVTAQDEDSAKIEGPAAGSVGLLIIDMINDMAFPGAEAMRPGIERAATAILALRAKADRLRVPVVYVNDNFGQWHSDKSKIVAACASAESPGAPIVRRVAPREDDFFVIKPQFSGFYATNLPVLLPKLGVSRLVLTGVAADVCVLFTAADAHMREYELWIPSDGVASESEERTRWALQIMRNSMQAETASTAELSLEAWIGHRRQ